MWYLKLQNTVETSTIDSEFMAAKTDTDLSIKVNNLYYGQSSFMGPRI